MSNVKIIQYSLLLPTFVMFFSPRAFLYKKPISNINYGLSDIECLLLINVKSWFRMSSVLSTKNKNTKKHQILK